MHLAPRFARLERAAQFAFCPLECRNRSAGGVVSLASDNNFSGSPRPRYESASRGTLSPFAFLAFLKQTCYHD